MVNQPIFDYHFSVGDRAIFTGISKNGEESSVIVKIIGETNYLGDKYYIVTGPRTLLDIGADEEHMDIDKPSDWVVCLADPDELDLCFMNNLKVVPT